LTPTTAPTTSRRPGPVFFAILLVVFVAAAVGAAYFDWIYWDEERGSSLLLGLGAIVLILVGGPIAIFARGFIRRSAFVVLALSVGIFAGLFLGPSREPLIYQTGGTMTLHLTSPIVATATGESTCQNVASGTEFQIGNDENSTRLDTPDPAFVSIFINKGGRWADLSPDHRANGVYLAIRITPTAITSAGKPSTSGQQTVSSSRLESTMTNAGGSITFGSLETMTGPDFGGAPMDLAGTIEWTCG
jgi:hypothetical protein